MEKTKINFMGLPSEYSNENSFFCVIPVEYEKDTTYGDGASKGSKEIIRASKHLEYYDEQFDIEPFIEGIFTSENLKLNDLSPEDAIEKIRVVVSGVKTKFPIILGGDHSVTIGAVKGLESVHDDFSVVIFDAHSDFRYSWNNSRLNHACVSRNIVNNHEVLIIGVRSQDKDEADEIKENKNISVIKSYDYNMDELREFLKNIKDKVYVSIDVDVFDPAFIRNTGTPEPGGFSWNEMINALTIIFDKKKVIGADIVEFAPKENFESESYALAKLCYKLMGLKKIKN